MTASLFSKFILIGTFSTLALASCNSAKQTAGAKNQTGNYLTLADYLRRFPSVRITGSGDDLRVFIRTADTLQGENFEALFVIDKNTFTDTYAQAARIVDVNDIQSVTVLKPLEATSQFGLRGSNGAILIKTKTEK